MAQTLIKLIADFDTTLASKVAVGAETATLTSATDDDGVTLATGTYGLTIDRKNSSKEYITCTLTGTSLTNIKSISRSGVITTGFARTHRKGAEVIISDFVAIKRINNVLDGTTSLDASTPLKYDGDPTLTLDAQIATKKYIDDVAISGGAKATNSIYGISKLSVAAVSGTEPIVVGDNDTRVPTQDENNALAGTSGTPSSSNKYVTNDDTAETGNSKVIRTKNTGLLDSSIIPTQFDFQEFTSSGTWTKPSGLTGNETVIIRAWGAGGNGGVGGNGGSGTGDKGGGGGGGGAYVEEIYKLSNLGATETVTVGATSGQTTTFGSLVTALGGTAGTAGTLGSGGGAGGNSKGFGISIYLGGAVGTQSIYGGAGGNNGGNNGAGSNGANAIFGGAGGGGGSGNDANLGGTGGTGKTGYGGAGGNGGVRNAVGGNTGSAGAAGTAPGGGGGGGGSGTSAGGAGGAGAAGYVSVTIFK